MKHFTSCRTQLITLGLLLVTILWLPSSLTTEPRRLPAGETGSGLNRWSAPDAAAQQSADLQQPSELEQTDEGDQTVDTSQEDTTQTDSAGGPTQEAADVDLPLETPAASAATTAEDLNSVFDFSALSAAQTKWAVAVLDGTCDFDWKLLSRGLDGDHVKIRFGSPPAQGMYYPGEKTVEVHHYFFTAEPEHAARIMMWEMAHAVDFLWISPSQRGAIKALYLEGSQQDAEWLSGQYEDQIGESFMEGFVSAFCPSLALPYSDFTYKTTPAISDGIRQVLTN